MIFTKSEPLNLIVFEYKYLKLINDGKVPSLTVTAAVARSERSVKSVRDICGGCLINQGQHILDIWQWLFGMPESVSAFYTENLL